MPAVSFRSVECTSFLAPGALGVPQLEGVSTSSASLSQRGLNQGGATMTAKSHPHPYDTPLSKEAAINWHTAHSSLVITLSSLVSCTAWFKERGSGSPSGTKS